MSSFPQVLIWVEKTSGSVPRERGASMVVTGQKTLGSIGGGHLEFQAIYKARQWLADRSPGASFADCQSLEGGVVSEQTDICLDPQDDPPNHKRIWQQRFALGPSLGQCCGGVVWLCYEWIEEEASANQRRASLQGPLQPIALFGAGHVGSAIARALEPLAFQLTWFDSRDDYPAEPVDTPQAEVPGLKPESFILIMSYSHAEDLEIVLECLLRRQKEPGCFPFIGLIGSQTKWARFQSRLLQRGVTQAELKAVTCPIGLPGIKGKEPAVIAASVVAQLLSLRSL